MADNEDVADLYGRQRRDVVDPLPSKSLIFSDVTLPTRVGALSILCYLSSTFSDKESGQAIQYRQTGNQTQTTDRPSGPHDQSSRHVC